MTTTRQAAAEADAAAAAAAAASAALASAAAAAAAKKAAAAAAAAASAAADAAPKAGDAARPPRRSLAPREPSGFGSQQRRSMLPAWQSAVAPPLVQKPAAGAGRDGPERGRAQGETVLDQTGSPAVVPDEARLLTQLPAEHAAAPSDACSVACLGAPECHSENSAQAAAHLTYGLAPAHVHFKVGTSVPLGRQDRNKAEPRAAVHLCLSLPDIQAAWEVGGGTARHARNGDGALMQAAAAHLRQSLFGTLPAQQALGGAGSHPVRPEALPGVSAAAREAAADTPALGARASGTGALAGSTAPTAHGSAGQNPAAVIMDPSKSSQPDLHVADDMMAAALGRRAAASRVGLGLGHARRSLVQLAAAVVDAPGLTPGRGITPPSGDAAPAATTERAGSRLCDACMSRFHSLLALKWAARQRAIRRHRACLKKVPHPFEQPARDEASPWPSMDRTHVCGPSMRREAASAEIQP